MNKDWKKTAEGFAESLSDIWESVETIRERYEQGCDISEDLADLDMAIFVAFIQNLPTKIIESYKFHEDTESEV